jgi:hypothetical protein
MGVDVLQAMGRHPFEAHRAARTFKSHDEKLVRLSAAHADDTEKLVDIARKGRAEIENVLGEDMRTSELPQDHAWEPPDRTRE